MISSLLILAMTAEAFQALVMGWISVATVILVALIGLAAKLTPLIKDLITQIRDTIHLQNETNRLTAARLDHLSNMSVVNPSSELSKGRGKRK